MRSSPQDAGHAAREQETPRAHLCVVSVPGGRFCLGWRPECHAGFSCWTHFPFRSAREFVTPSGLHFGVSPLEMPGALQRPVSSHGALGASPVRGLHLYPQAPPQGWATAGAGTDVPGKWSPCSGNSGLAGCHPLSPVNRPKGR